MRVDIVISYPAAGCHYFRPTATNRDQLQNPMLGNRLRAIPLPFTVSKLQQAGIHYVRRIYMYIRYVCKFAPKTDENV